MRWVTLPKLQLQIPPLLMVWLWLGFKARHFYFYFFLVFLAWFVPSSQSLGAKDASPFAAAVPQIRSGRGSCWRGLREP